MDGGGRDTRVTIRVTHYELAIIQKRAAESNLSVAGYLRALGTGAMDRQGVASAAADYLEPETFDLCRKFTLLSSLSETELVQALDKIQLKRCVKNQVVLKQEDANRFMYVILSGSVKVHTVTEEGREIILALHRDGDFFGELSLIDGKTVSATVSANEDSVIAIVSRDDFYALLKTHERILFNLLQTLCQRIRSSNSAIEVMSHTHASQRVRMILLMLAGRHGRRDGVGVLFLVPLTHQDIANMAGLTRETVSRVMGELKENGEITISKNRGVRLNESFFHGSLAPLPGSE